MVDGNSNVAGDAVTPTEDHGGAGKQNIIIISDLYVWKTCSDLALGVIHFVITSPGMAEFWIYTGIHREKDDRTKDLIFH